MLLQDAEIHYDEDSCISCPLGRLFVNDALLKPNGRSLDLDSLFHDLRNGVGPPEHVDNVDLLGHIEKRRVSFFAQPFLDRRIYRDDAIAVRTHVLRDAEAWAHGGIRQADDSDGLSRMKQFRNLFE